MTQEKLNDCLRRLKENGGFIDEAHKREYEELVSKIYNNKIIADYVAIDKYPEDIRDDESTRYS